MISNVLRATFAILHKNSVNKNEKTFSKYTKSRDAAAKKRANASGLGKSNNYCEDIPPYNTTH